MNREKLTPERFEELSDALAWQGERRWVLGARMVEGHPYSALAEETGRSVGALREDVCSAWKEADEYEARRDEEAAAEEDEPETVGLMGYALMWWHLTDRVWPLWAVVAVMRQGMGFGRERPLTPEEEEARIASLLQWREQRMLQFLAGEAPHPY